MLHETLLSWILEQGSTLLVHTKHKERKFNQFWAALCNAKYAPREERITNALFTVVEQQKDLLTSGAYLHITNELGKSHAQESQGIFEVNFRKYGIQETSQAGEMQVYPQTESRHLVLSRDIVKKIQESLAYKGSASATDFDLTEELATRNNMSVVTGISTRESRVSALKTQLSIIPWIEITNIQETGLYCVS